MLSSDKTRNVGVWWRLGLNRESERRLRCTGWSRTLPSGCSDASRGSSGLLQRARHDDPVNGAQEARRQAVRLLDAGLLGGAPPSAQVLDPVPVVAGRGELWSWFGPVAVGDDLVGLR